MHHAMHHPFRFCRRIETVDTSTHNTIDQLSSFFAFMIRKVIRLFTATWMHWCEWAIKRLNSCIHCNSYGKHVVCCISLIIAYHSQLLSLVPSALICRDWWPPGWIFLASSYWVWMLAGTPRGSWTRRAGLSPPHWCASSGCGSPDWKGNCNIN